MGSLADRDKQYVWHPFTPMRLWLDSEPVVIERGEGAYLFDSDGKRYIDGVSSLWCNVHGHRHEHIDSAIRKHLGKIAHSTLLGLGSGPSIELAEELVKISPDGLAKVFYSDSGATAVEIAIKIAFQYWRNLGATRRRRFVALRQSYHGDTVGSISVGGIKTFHEIFGPLTFEADFAETPLPYRFDGSAEQCRDHCLADLKGILQRQEGEIAAIVVEPLVQGAAGMIVHPSGFLAGVRRLADKYDVLLIADEVATGFGRTGTMFACEQEQVSPDIMCVGKGLTGGYLPVAATLTSERVFEAFLAEPIRSTTFYHGHTYTGNALGCAAAVANLEVFEKERTIEGLTEKTELIGEHLAGIAKLEHVGDVRQKGMMAGIELVEDKERAESFAVERRIGARLCQRIRQRGLMLRPLQDVIVVMPPLAIEMDVLDELMATVEAGIERDLAGLAADG